MTHRRLPRLLALTLLWIAPALASAEEAGQAEAGWLSGRYRVSGETVDKATGVARGISGTISLQQEGGAYTTNFELRTVLPGSEASPAQAQVLGTGSGQIEGRKLRGTADTQILSSPVPGVDAGFVGMPRQISARIRSSSLAEIAEDGSIRIEIDNEPAEGEAYRPTRTVLKGERETPRPAR